MVMQSETNELYTLGTLQNEEFLKDHFKLHILIFAHSAICILTVAV